MQNPREFHNIALVGFMGTGKTSVGHLVAGQLHFQFVDTDALIEQRAGASITAIFARDGEEAFRAMESGVVTELASSRRTVISTGGGLVKNPQNLASLQTHSLVVCLWASAETIYERVRTQTHRPLLQCPDPLERIRALLAEREPFYRKSDILLSTEFRHVREVAQLVVNQFRLARMEARTP